MTRGQISRTSHSILRILQGQVSELRRESKQEYYDENDPRLVPIFASSSVLQQDVEGCIATLEHLISEVPKDRKHFLGVLDRHLQDLKSLCTSVARLRYRPYEEAGAVFMD